MPEYSFLQIVQDLFFPWRFLAIALSALPPTIWDLAVRRHDLAALVSPSRLKAAWFGRFWAQVGPHVRMNAERRVVPLLRGRVSGGRVLGEDDEGGNKPVSGTVIEIGPGSGMWVSLFSDEYLLEAPTEDVGVRRRAQDKRQQGITQVLGVEPNADLHDALRARVREAGLEGTYRIVPAGIEDLARVEGGARPESVDCVVSVLCLCGIPDPQKSIRELYACLKPGGRWYVYEHVRCHKGQGLGMRVYQALVNLVWPHFVGGCELRRETGTWLKEAGPWSHVDLEWCDDQPWFSTLPHVLGVLTK